jgi:choline dehydrogenase-like flavoprotein
LKQELPIKVLSDHLIGPSARTIMNSALNLGYPWKKLEKFIYQEQCTSQHFPLEAQGNSLRYLDEAIRNGAELVSANVTKVLTNRYEAIGVEYIDQFGIHQVYSPRIILSAGGVGSAQILQSSGIAEAGDGLFVDPLIIVQGLIKGIEVGNEIPMATGMVCEEGYILTDITLPKLVYQLFAAQVLRFHRLHQHSNTVSIMVKVRDSIGGKITKDGKIYKDITESDKRKMRQGMNHAIKILQNAGVRRIFRTAWTAAHPGGSIRIGNLVDSNLETRNQNLFVCDCSVIPEEWGLPPTLTILALAKRLSKYLLR